MSSVGDRVVWVASKLWFVWFVLHCELFVSCLSIVAVSLLIVPTSCCVFCMTWHRMRLEHAVARSSEQWWMISTLHWYQELHSWTCFCTVCCTDYMSFPCTNCSRYSTWSFLSLMPCRPTCIITPDCFQSSRMTLASSLACCAFVFCLFIKEYFCAICHFGVDFLYWNIYIWGRNRAEVTVVLTVYFVNAM